jgi:hypothetical protein
MNHASSLHRTAILQRPNVHGPVLGWGISLLIHALAVAWVWHAWQPYRAETDAGPVRRIELRLVPIAPKVRLPPPAPNATAPRSTPNQMRAALGPPPPPPSQAHERVAAGEPSAIAADPPADAAADATVTGTGSNVPAVDLAAARATARLIARESGKGLVALPKRKPVIDANADHHVVDPLERARRVDCQKARAESINLLANVVMLAVDLAKNAVDDSGCKW